MRRAALLASIALLFAGAAPASAGDVRLVKTRGDVVILRGEKLLTASSGMRCRRGDQVLTRGPAEADLAWGGLWGCRMLDSTILSVTGTDPASMAVRLEKGFMLFRFRRLPPDCAFNLDTPTAIAAVRGTQFAVRVTDEGGRNRATFAVLKGKLRVEPKSGGKPLPLRAGEASDVFAGEAPKPRLLTAAERADLAQAGRLSLGASDGAYDA
ncbi:MAG TPA: FecR domain-containing protein [Candidatus Eisenbacteria bacterium]|nr:FecR domain-containing protein [Candidatus Eisenbacteria bacterium]